MTSRGKAGRNRLLASGVWLALCETSQKASEENRQKEIGARTCSSTTSRQYDFISKAWRWWFALIVIPCVTFTCTRESACQLQTWTALTHTVILNFSRSLLTISSFMAANSSTSHVTARYLPFSQSRCSLVSQVSQPWIINQLRWQSTHKHRRTPQRSTSSTSAVSQTSPFSSEWCCVCGVTTAPGCT